MNTNEMPRGVELRGGRLRIVWQVNKKRYTETLDFPCTAEGIAAAAARRNERVRATKEGVDWMNMVVHPVGTVVDLGAAYGRAFSGARKRDPHYALTKDDETKLIKAAAGKCQLTGIVFTTERFGHNKSPFAPSLDRIDSSQGYTVGNVRLVSVATNLAMNVWGESVLNAIAQGYVSTTVFGKTHTLDMKQPLSAPNGDLKSTIHNNFN